MWYEVWFAPTTKGIKEFNWKYRLLKVFTIIIDAQDFAYFEWVDDSTPDKGDYYHFILIPQS